MAESAQATRLPKLKGTRAAHRGQMTKLLRKAEDIINTLPQDCNDDLLDEITATLELLHAKYELLVNLDKQIVDANPRSPSTGNVTSAQTTPSGSSSAINLPKLSLPMFSGDILQWVSFRDAYNSAIHDNTNLDTIQKFQYLRAQLTGEAASIIDGLMLTNDNYAHAIDLLNNDMVKSIK
ncbi:uncharacterized protein LOC144350098 [Saccoglossus kowalevskii]